MTKQPNLKSRVRARMDRTGERYSVARDHVLAAGGRAPAHDTRPRLASGVGHFPGVHAESTALRTLAAHAGVRDAAGGPLSEALSFVVAGGIGIGIFAFVYGKEDFSNLFIGGGYRWDDSRAVLEDGARRHGLEPVVEETGGSRQAAALLEAATARGPVVAWVDLAEIGTRGYPAAWSGGGYHVLVVFGHPEGSADWLIGDLSPHPMTVGADVLARARARIGKQRNRILSIAPAEPGGAHHVPSAVRAGLAATVDGLRNPRTRNFGLEALADLADRIAGSGRDSWTRAFPPGRRLWSALRSIHLFVECHGTGGGLLRPLFARGLQEAAPLIGDKRLDGVATRYEELGRRWSELAAAALPDEVPLLREAREIQAANAGRYLAEGAAAAGPNAAGWQRLGKIEEACAVDFPLSAEAVERLRADLAARVRELHRGEVEALAALTSVVEGSAG